MYKKDNSQSLMSCINASNITMPSNTQFIILSGTTTGNTGSTVSYTVPSSKPTWLTSTGTITTIQLGKGQYILSMILQNASVGTFNPGSGNYSGIVTCSLNGTNKRQSLASNYGNFPVYEQLTELLTTDGTVTFSSTISFDYGTFQQNPGAQLKIMKTG